MCVGMGEGLLLLILVQVSGIMCVRTGLKDLPTGKGLDGDCREPGAQQAALSMVRL